MIHIMIGGAGCGKSTRLIHLLQQQIEKEERIFTLVPEQFSYEFDQKLYRILGPSAFNQLETHSFKSLARAIFRQFGNVPDGKTNADDLTRTALIYQAILYTSEREKSLQLLGKQCKQASFVDELATLFSILRRSGVTPEGLYDSCSTLTGRLQEKTMDFFHIYQKYDQLLLLHQQKDTETELTEAAAIANGQDAFLGDVLCIDEFESFTEDEYELLHVLFSSCKDVFLALRTDEAEETPFSLFETVNRTLHRIKRIATELHIPVEIERCTTPYRFQSADLAWLSTHVFRNSSVFEEDAPNIHILEATTPNEEAEYVCTTIRRLLAKDASLHCRDIVVLTNQLSEYQSILETVMERYQLPYHLDEKQSILYAPMMVYLHTILELLRAKHPDTELLLRFGKTNLTDCSMTEIAELENYCYTWQIDGDTWKQPFSGGDFASAEEIRQKLLAPITSLQKSCQKAKTGADFCQILYRFFETQHVEKRLNQQLFSIAEDSCRQQTQDEWAHVWNSIIDIFDHMASLYEDVEIELSEFCAIFSAMTRSITRSVPPRTLDAILISQGSTARVNAPKIVFLIGTCEGIFPMQSGGNGIFSEKDCVTLEQFSFSIVKSKPEQMADARLAAYKLLSSASQTLYLTYPCVDVSQQKCYPATVLTQIQRMFPYAKKIKQTSKALHSAYYATTLHAAYYRYIQDYAAYSTDTASIEQVLLQDSFYQKRLMALTELTEQHQNRNDMPLFHIDDEKFVQSYIGDMLQLSASSLEAYQLCPFSYFCNYMLRLFHRQKVQVSGSGSGSLIHYCLEQLLKEFSRDDFVQLSPDVINHAIQRYASKFWQENMGGNFSKSGRELSAYHHTIAGMQQLILHMQEEFQQSAFYPAYLELQISPNNPDFPPLKLETQTGQSLQLVGKIDRVDLCQDGDQLWVRVVDYKTGIKKFSLGNLLFGLDLQMLIYLFTITAPNSGLSNAEPAGVLYMPSGKVKNDLERGAFVSRQKKCNDTYHMNGFLLEDPHLITLMERDGKGIYVPGKITSDDNIEKKSGTFLNQKQMRHLRQYVFHQLVTAATRIYQGEIDANPLFSSDKDSCAYCVYANICGNANHEHKRECSEKKKDLEKQMLEILEEDDTAEGEMD